MGVKTVAIGSDVKYVKRKQNTPSTSNNKVSRGA